jgi:hypothetical protein
MHAHLSDVSVLTNFSHLTQIAAHRRTLCKAVEAKLCIFTSFHPCVLHDTFTWFIFYNDMVKPSSTKTAIYHRT